MLKKFAPKFLWDKDPWLLAEEIPDSDVFFFQIPMSAFCSDSSYPFLKNYTKVLTHYKKFHMDFYLGEKDSFLVGESVLKALLTKPSFGNDVNKNILKWSNKLIDFSKAAANLNLKNYTNKQLWQVYAEQDKIHTKLYTYGWLPVAVDMFHNNFTKNLKSYLYSVCDSKQEAESAFIVLTTPSKKTIVAQEREDFLNIFKKFTKSEALSLRVQPASPELHRGEPKQPFQRDKIASSSAKALTPRNDKFLNQLLNEHALKWGHLGYIYAGNVKPFAPNYYLKEMRDLAESGIKPERILQKEQQQLKSAKNKQLALHKKYNISNKYQELFETARDFALTKLVRRHAQLLCLYLMHNSLLPEIAKRINRTRYQVQFMLYGEVRQALLNGKILSKPNLQNRFKECVLYTEKNFETIYTGPTLKKLTKNLKRVFDKNQKELVGQTAQPGYAKGTVKIILRAKDMRKMNKGDILVSIATDPDIVPAMKLAAAIVTEQGGITSHAAIVSRELGTPCVIGTKIATKIFKDGDLVEVDANKGIVRKVS